MENVIAKEFRSSGRKAAKGILGVFITILAAVGIGTFSSEYAKDSRNAAFAAKRAGRNIACIAGMLVIELALLLMVLLTGPANGIGHIAVDAILLAGHYSVFELIRIMRNKIFLIHVKFMPLPQGRSPYGTTILRIWTVFKRFDYNRIVPRPALLIPFLSVHPKTDSESHLLDTAQAPPDDPCESVHRP